MHLKRVILGVVPALLAVAGSQAALAEMAEWPTNMAAMPPFPGQRTGPAVPGSSVDAGAQVPFNLDVEAMIKAGNAARTPDGAVIFNIGGQRP